VHRTDEGAKRIVATARSTTFDVAERARAPKPPTTDTELDAIKQTLDGLNELGLTNVHGVALPDTRALTPEQTKHMIDVSWNIRKATVQGGAELTALLDTLAQALRELGGPPVPLPAPQPPVLAEPLPLEPAGSAGAKRRADIDGSCSSSSDDENGRSSKRSRG